MMDGLPLSGGSDGAIDLSSIPVSALTAIEVQSGSQAVIAGDAAIGGAVNLITRSRVANDAARLSSSAGEWGRTRQELSIAKSTSHVSLSGGGEYDQRRNPYQFFDVNTDSSGRRQNSRLDERRAFLRLSGWRKLLEVLGYASRNERGVPGTVERPMLTAFTRNKNARIQSARQFGFGNRDRGTVAGWYEFSSEYYNASSERIPQHTYLREHFLGVKVSHSTSVFAIDWHSDMEIRHRLIHGEDFQRPAFSFGDEQRSEYSMRSRMTRQIGRLSLNCGLSLDADGENSPAWSPRFDASFRPLNSVSLGVGWGRSFRRPLLMTAFWKTDYYTQGNPDLLSERAEEWDVSARWRNRNIAVDTRYFERTIDNIIVWDLRGIPQKYTPVNLAAGEVIGREDHIGLSTSSGNISIDYTHVFNDGSDRSGQSNYEGETLPFMPRHTHDLTVRGAHGSVAVFATCRWVGLREALRSNTNRWQEPYRAFDVDLRVTASAANPHVVVFVRADNITNEPIELLEGYPSPARTFTAGITVGIK
jgi:outer membrane cobalamin receptor